MDARAVPARRKSDRKGVSAQIDGLENLCLLWEARQGLPDAQARRLAEYLNDALAASVGAGVWAAALADALRRVRTFYPPN